MNLGKMIACLAPPNSATSSATESLMKKPRSVHSILVQTVVNFWNDDCLSMGAAIAFYTIFLLPPLLVIAAAIASLVFEPAVVQRLVAKETATEFISR